jgi:hypothetical protein
MRMNKAMVAVTMLFHASFLVTATAGTNKESSPSQKTLLHENCPLWLAPSNLNFDKDVDELVKYGLFAGQEYPQNTTLPFPELVIPVIDMFEDIHRSRPRLNNVLSFLEDILWAPAFSGGQWEGNSSVPSLIPGIGTLSLYHTTYSNVQFIQAAVLQREPMVGDGTVFPQSGKAHLTRGVITPYYNATLRATERIPAGMELFADYGCMWIILLDIVHILFSLCGCRCCFLALTHTTS